MPGTYSPIQSLEVGETTPLQEAVTELPAATVVGLALRLGPEPPPPPVVTLKELLVASRVEKLLVNRRSS